MAVAMAMVMETRVEVAMEIENQADKVGTEAQVMEMATQKEAEVEVAMEEVEDKVEKEAGTEVTKELAMEVAVETVNEVDMEAATQKETEMEDVEDKEVEKEAGMEVGKESAMETVEEIGQEVENEAGMEVGEDSVKKTGMDTAVKVAEVEKEVVIEVRKELAMEIAVETVKEIGQEVREDSVMKTGMDTAVEAGEVEDDILEPVSAPKKRRRLRKVREMEVKESEAVEEVEVVVGGERESAEEILKRFGKGGEGGTKRKAVQSTILAAVVDMAKQVKDVVDPEEVVRGSDAEDAPQEEEREELAADTQELAPLSKKKRSNTVTRCSARVTGLTFESGENEGVDNFENAPGIDGDMNKDVPEGSDTENGTAGDEEDMEDDGRASDSEKGDVGNDLEEEVELNVWTETWEGGDGLSMDSILEKARKMVAEMSKPAELKPPKEKKKDKDGQEVKKKKLSKNEEERLKREEIFAESQRLLRESKGVAFVSPAPVTKPVSSVLEKIRQRRLQLNCSNSGSVSSHDVERKLVSRRATEEKSSTYVDLTIDDDTEVEIEIFCSKTLKIDEVKLKDVVVDVQLPHKSTDAVSEDKEAPQFADADGEAEAGTGGDEKSPGAPEVQKDLSCDDPASGGSDEEDPKLEPSQQILATQDLFCTSQLSPATEETVEAASLESVVTTVSDIMGLETQLMDEELILRPIRDDHHPQNKETGLRPSGQSEVFTTATHVRGLIDDEAEDEDEDILAENAEEEEALGDEDDLQDLIAASEKEKAGDKARRDALHRQWLQQQDTEQTEDILERLRTGRSTRWKGRDRVGSCLDEDDDPVSTRDSESLDKSSLDDQTGADDPFAEEDQIEEPSNSLRQRTRSQELEMDCLLDDAEDVEDFPEPEVEDEIIEDDEEHEQSIIRKRMLEESEEQLVFMSPAEDESSREVLSLINKVNVGNLTAKSTSGNLETRGLGSTSHPTKPSFLGRNSSSSSLPPPTHRQVGSGGGSRSFVFGRDDSNSGHGFPPQEEKNPAAVKSASVKGVTSTSSLAGKKRPAPQSTNGPSLFEMLKKQSAEHDQGQKTSASAISKKWSSNSEAFSIFASKKSVTISRRKS